MPYVTDGKVVVGLVDDVYATAGNPVWPVSAGGGGGGSWE
jgi:hypothetical protein